MHKQIVHWFLTALIMFCASIAAAQAPPAAVSSVAGDKVQKGSMVSPGTADTKAQVAAGTRRVAPASKEEYSARLEEARQKAAVGNYTEAIAGFEEVANKAHESNDSVAEAESSLRLARTLELSNAKARLDDASFARAKLAYTRAIQVGDAGQQAPARNGLATLLLHQGDPAAALEQLHAINLQQVDAQHRAVYRYNLGVANERSGKWAEAYTSYVAAIADKPEYESSAKAAFGLLRSSSEPRVAEAAKFNGALLSAGQISSAGHYTKQLLEQWAGRPDSQQLLAALLQYYAVSPLTLDDLRTQEWPYIEHLASSAPHLREAIENIKLACFGTFPPVFDHYQALDLFHGWAGEDWQQAAMARMLKRAGDEFKKKGNFQDALSRYSAAWALGIDSDAALYAASILHDQKQLIDSNQRLFGQLLNGIIEVKGMDYSRLDWPNILRMHALLGTIFEQEKHWGSETELRSAIFQWRHAIDAENHIRQTNPQYPRSPELYMKLANAYREKGDPQAVEFYLLAAEVFAQDENAKPARSALNAAESLGGPKSPSTQERIKKIDVAIRNVESGQT